MIDDAIHLRDPQSATRTVCGQPLDGRNVASYDQWFAIDWGTGCWSCISEAQDAARAATALSREGSR